MKKILITTPIYYPNDQLHIGHAYTTTLADYLARYKRNNDYKVMFLTGSDEHGQKIDDTAKKHNITTKEYVDNIVKSFKNLWEKLGISYDSFIRTTDEQHKQFVKEMFSQLLEKGFIYKGEYTDYYCKPCESYYTKTQLKDGKCPTCGREVTLLSEETYFLKVTEFKDFITFKLKNTDLLTPSHRVNELVNNFLENDFTDLSVTRTTFDWGIKTNEDPKHVIYVWLDALFNYVSALTYPGAKLTLEEVWSKESSAEIIQFVGKEITRFHCIYWPIMLEMANLKLPKVIAHGWLLSGDTKMSKSLGNVINPLDIIEKYGKDALRFYLINNIQTGEDGKFTEELFLETYNGILVNKYSNLVNRTFTMLEKYNNSIIPSKEFTSASILGLKNKIVSLETEYEKCMKEFRFSDSTKTIINVMEELNKFIDLEQPWTKTKEQQIEIVSALMYGLLDLNILLSTILLDSTDKFFEAIGTDKNKARQTKLEGKKINKLDFLFTRLK